MPDKLATKINQMIPLLNEKQLRRYLGSEAEALGLGGIALVSKISGKSRNTIVAGMKENSMPDENPERVRKRGGGRKPIKEKYPEIMWEIERIVSDSTCGNPEKPLTCTTKSRRKIKQELNEKGYEIGHNVVGTLLEEMGYSLQLNQKMLQKGKKHPDRNNQFEYINAKAKDFWSSAIQSSQLTRKRRNLSVISKITAGHITKRRSPHKFWIMILP